MIGEALWALTEQHRQLAALRQRFTREISQADETAGVGGRPEDGSPTVSGSARSSSRARMKDAARPWVVTMGTRQVGRTAQLDTAKQLVDEPFMEGLAIAVHDMTGERWIRRGKGDWFDIRPRHQTAARRNRFAAEAAGEFRARLPYKDD